MTTIENPISSSNHRVCLVGRRPSKADSWREVSFVCCRERIRGAVLTSLDQGSGLVIEVGLAIVHLDDRREVVIPQTQIYREAPVNLQMVLNKQRWRMLAVTHGDHRR